jgi:hypothetical protein
LLHDYTTDSASLLARLQQPRADSHGARCLHGQRECAERNQRSVLDALAECFSEADFFTSGRIVNTLSTLEAAARHLSGVPGRGNLICLLDFVIIGFDEFATMDTRPPDVHA